MEFYNVKIVGQQKHISGFDYETLTHGQVAEVIYKHWNEDHCDEPVIDFEDCQELNNDHNIIIEKAKI